MKLATAAMAAFLTATSAFAEVEQKMQVIYCSSDHSDFERMYGPTEVVYGPDLNAFGFAFAVLENDEYKALDHTLPERGHAALCVASAGYKVFDKYAARISKGGKTPKLRGRAHWIIVDPQADYAGNFCTAFKDPIQAEAYMSGLQNLRAA